MFNLFSVVICISKA